MKKSRFIKYFIPFFSGLIVLALLIFSSNLIIQTFNNFENDEIPTIMAPKGPIKEKPKFNSGKNFINTTQEFWGIFDSDNGKDEIVEILKPLEPETPPVNIVNEKVNLINKNSNESNNNENGSKDIETSINNSLQLENSDPKEKLNDNDINDIIPLPSKRPTKPNNNKTKEIIKYNYYVQLASFNNEKLAEKTTKVLEEKLVIPLAGQNLILMKVDLGKDKGFWWRIITNLIDRNEAESICSLLKKQGQNCIVRSNKL